MEKWRTKNGTEMKVKDMTTTHIQNCIKCIEEGKISFIINMGWEEDNDFQMYDEDYYEKERWLKIFKKELKRRLERS